MTPFSDRVGGQALIAVITAGASESGLACKLLGNGCFTGDTGVVTGYDPATGVYSETPIADIHVGDLVLSRDQYDAGGVAEREVVTGVQTHVVYALQDVTVADGAGGQAETIRTTAGHPFYVDGQGWTGAGALTAGERVELADGTYATVTGNAVEAVPAGVTVYTLTVDGDHTYFVGGGDTDATYLWVHNACSETTLAAIGRAMHNVHADLFEMSGYTVRTALGNGLVPDAFKIVYSRGVAVRAIIRELKPNNARAAARGLGQLIKYADQIEQDFGVPIANIKIILDTYIR